MKRAEAILQLAKEISDLREKKSSVESELRQLSDRLRDANARFRVLVPNADDAIDDVVEAPQPVGEGSLMQQILVLMQRDTARSWSVDDVLALCPTGTKIGTLRSSMSRLKLRGKLEKVDHGLYRLPASPGAPATPVHPAQARLDEAIDEKGEVQGEGGHDDVPG
jgi:hypothetical protein